MKIRKGTLHTDGACFGNPGPMGFGIVLTIEGDPEIEKSIFGGHGTNNISEYTALKNGVQLALENNVTQLDAFLDSQLVEKQIIGEWKIKDETLRSINEDIQQLISKFDSFSITHIPRAKNAQADMLSKLGVEQGS